MSAERELEQTGNLGAAWLLLCLSFAANILDGALNDFLGYYNATVLTLYGHFSWFPRIDLTFREWLVGMIVADAVLLFLTPLAYRDSVYSRPLAYAFGVIMVLFGCGTVFASLLGRTVSSEWLPAPILLLSFLPHQSIFSGGCELHRNRMAVRGMLLTGTAGAARHQRI